MRVPHIDLVFVNMYKDANHYNESFHQILVNFTKILQCEREIFIPGIQL